MLTSMNIILPLYPVQCILPPPPQFPYLFYTSLSTWFSGFLSISFYGTGASDILLSTCSSSLLLTCPYHFSLFSVIFYVTGSTFADPFACSCLILSFFVIPHICRNIIISFTSSLFSWLLVVDRVSDPYTNAGFSTVLYNRPL